MHIDILVLANKCYFWVVCFVIFQNKDFKSPILFKYLTSLTNNNLGDFYNPKVKWSKW